MTKWSKNKKSSFKKQGFKKKKLLFSISLHTKNLIQMDQRPKHKICRVSKPLYFTATSGFKLRRPPDLGEIGSPRAEQGKAWKRGCK